MRGRRHADRQARRRDDRDFRGATAISVTVRGRDLADDLMGETTFTEFFFLLATGRVPTEEQRFFLDLSLVAIAEHGLTPSVQAARMTFAADPAALQGAVAAGVLGCGTVILGAADLCRKLLDDVLGARRVSGLAATRRRSSRRARASRGAQADSRLRPSAAQTARSARRAHDRARARARDRRALGRSGGRV